MPADSTTLAIIPARGGSRRVPRKNVRLFHGKPMLAWSIEKALHSGLFSRVIVSTDDDEIAQVAKDWGAEVPFSRPPELADDHATTRSVIQHSITAMRQLDMEVQKVCCIVATAPFLQLSDLAAGHSALDQPGCSFSYSVCRFTFPIQRAIKLNAEGRVERFFPEFRNCRSQDLEPAFHDAAQFYWGWADAFLDPLAVIPSPASIPILLPNDRVLDIDTPEDWDRAEQLFSLYQPAHSAQPT